MRVKLDIEARSRCDLSKHGAYRYAWHPSTVILCVSYSVDGAPPQLWWAGMPLPDCFLSDTAVYVCHNVQFDRIMFDRHIRPTRVDQWDDTMIRCLYCALPPALDDAAKALFGLKKDPRGKELVGSVTGKGVCRPQRKRSKKGEPPTEYWNNDPEALRILGEYCLQDCDLLNRLDDELPPLPTAERDAWLMYERMNDRGVLIDVQLATGATRIMGERQIDAESRLAQLTGGAVTSSGQIDRIKAFVNDRLNAPLDDPALVNCQEDTIAEFLTKEALPEDVRGVLETRKSSNSAAVKKYDAALQRVCADGRVHGAMIFYGAHTGRSSSRGLQLQNAKRGKEKYYLPYSEVARAQDFAPYDGWVDWNYHLSYGVRRMFIAPEGHVYVVEDYAGIEARMVDWLVYDYDALQKYRDGIDGYKILAAKIHGVHVDLVNSDQRNVGKESRLSGQYGIGWKQYKKRMLKKWGLSLSSQEARLAITTFRSEHWRIRRAWSDIERAWRSAVLGAPSMACRCLFSVENSWMMITGPDGRTLFYWAPSYDMSYGVVGRSVKNKDTGKLEPLRKHSYPGAVLENIAQWLAGVIARDDMTDIDRRGLGWFCFMVHDEHIMEVREDRALGVQKEVESIMKTPKWWAPDLPLEVEGWVGKHYRK